MGRQFSYYCSPEDLADIEANVFVPAGGRLLRTTKRDGREFVGGAAGFPLSRELMGSQPVILYLAPPQEIDRVVFDDGWLSASKSHLIEVWRCYMKGDEIRRGRFWYETSLRVDGCPLEKQTEFLEWAADIFRRTKKLLTRQPLQRDSHVWHEWCGPQAWKDLSNGTLRPLLD